MFTNRANLRERLRLPEYGLQEVEGVPFQLIDPADGKTEDHPLQGGKHIADYINRRNVPESKFAIAAADGGQLRYLAITPKRNAVIHSIELVKPDHLSAPLVLAMTFEQHGDHGKHAHSAVDAEPADEAKPAAPRRNSHPTTKRKVIRLVKSWIRSWNGSTVLRRPLKP